LRPAIIAAHRTLRDLDAVAGGFDCVHCGSNFVRQNEMFGCVPPPAVAPL